MPGGKIGGGGRPGGGGHIGGGGFRPSSGRSGSSSRPSGSRPSVGYTGGFGGGSFWQGMLFGSMMSNQNNRPSHQSYPQPTSYNTQGPFHQQPTFQQKPPQQQYQQAKESYTNHRPQSYGCLTALLIMIMFFLVFALMTNSCSSSGGVSKSTVDREKLDSKYVTRTAYFEDTAGVVRSSSTLERGLKAFYDETGVQPFVYFTEDINGDPNPSNSELDAYCDALYESLFDDEGHVLIVSYGEGFYGYWYKVGRSAATVFDAEAQEIFEDYANAYADDLVNDEIRIDEFYSTVFEKTGSRIMQVTPNYTVYYVIALVVLVILLVLYRWWIKVKEQKNKEAAHAEAILNADINDLANDPTLSDLEGKYENYPSSASTAAKPAVPKDEKPSANAETYEPAAEQSFKDPTLQELEDKYK